MKTAAINHFRSRLRAGESLYGLWVTWESPSVCEIAVALGLDWVVIDAEHGHLDWKEITEHLRAAVRSRTVALVRVTERNTSLIKRALDLGADGIVVPSVDTVEQLREMIRDCRYPPAGRRGIGAERATVWGECLAEHAEEANRHVLVIPMIESVTACDALPEMCTVDGVDGFFVGPADLSASAGQPGGWGGPAVSGRIVQIQETARSAGKFCGVMATSEADLLSRREQGFQLLGLGSDAGLFLRSLHRSLAAAVRDRRPSTDLDPAGGYAVLSPLERPPAAMQPDRHEVMTAPGQGERIQLQEGVLFEALVGKFNTARNLTTGLVTFEPQAVLDRHTHPCSESVTVLAGIAEVQVEGRVYRLGPLDNIVIPRWMPHTSRNPDASSTTTLHVALGTDRVERELVTREFPRLEMPDDLSGFPGCERVNRFATARRSYHVGPQTEFIDFFNADLVPGIEMSGGWGRFQPGGRLPAHLHDFDESICIIDGAAQCYVEGRQYELSGQATAMVPRGRVHYFVNDSAFTMDMIWVYAGPRPERVVVAESCATLQGAAWQ